MAGKELTPKLGRIRSTSSRKAKTYLNRITKETRRAAPAGKRFRGSSWTGSRNGRGFSTAAIQTSRAPVPGRRRVIVKARITRFKNGSINAAKAHLKYIQRDGVTREGEPGELYDAKSDRATAKDFLIEAEGDRHQFRLIVSPEDSAQLDDLKPFIRDLMGQVKKDLGTKLDWVAVDHFNTGHPHTHIVIRGKDDLGKDLIIARDYMAHGFRERARDLITRELGLETQHELDRKLSQEVTADRLTRIDHSLIKDARDGVLTLSSAPKHGQWQNLRTGRLNKLQEMGLAEELKPGVWKLSERMKGILRDMGQRNDILKTMQRVLKKAGIERGALDYAVFDATNPSSEVVGKVISLGLSDELNNRHYVLVDGSDGRLHYADIGLINKYDPPRAGLLVTLRGQDGGNAVRKFQQREVQIFVESHTSFEQLAAANGATWLDRKLIAKDQGEFREKGFGAEINKALRQRQQWLVEQGLLTQQEGQMIPQRRLLAELTRRDVSAAAMKIGHRLGLTHKPAIENMIAGAKPLQSIRLASGRFAIMQKGKEFSLVPWKRAITLAKGSGLGISSDKGISR